MATQQRYTRRQVIAREQNTQQRGKRRPNYTRHVTVHSITTSFHLHSRQNNALVRVSRTGGTSVPTRAAPGAARRGGTGQTRDTGAAAHTDPPTAPPRSPPYAGPMPSDRRDGRAQKELHGTPRSPPQLPDRYSNAFNCLSLNDNSAESPDVGDLTVRR